MDLKEIDILSTNIEDVMEIATVNIWINQRKSIVACCIYKNPPVTNNDFNTELESLFDKFLFNKKDTFVCGDFNMDLMKHIENKGTQKIYSQCLMLDYTLSYKNQPE